MFKKKKNNLKTLQVEILVMSIDLGFVLFFVWLFWINYTYKHVFS